MAAEAIPEGYNHISPYLLVENVPATANFLSSAFDAEEIRRTLRADGTVSHLELRVGQTVVMLSEARPEWPAAPAMLHLYVEDTDAVYKRAIAAGGRSVMEPADQYHGDRMAGVYDPSGNSWWIATHVEDISNEEMQRRELERSAG